MLMTNTITIHEVSSIAGVPTQTIDYWVKSGKVNRIIKDNRVYFDKDEILDFIKDRENILNNRKNKKKERLNNGIQCNVCHEKTMYTDYKVFTRHHLMTKHPEITTKEYYDITLKDDENICKLCGKEKSFLSIKRGYCSYCSDNTCNANNDEILEKIRASKLEKYGDKHYTNQEKAKATCLKKYGSEYYTNRDKFSETWSNKPLEERQNCRVPAMEAKNEKYRERISFTLKQFNCELVAHRSEEVDIKCNFCNKISTLSTVFLGCRIGRSINPCIHCQSIKSHISTAEKEIFEFVKTNYFGEVIQNDRDIISKEIDIYIPELKVGIEYNGCYWHSSLYKDKNYHLNKTKECRDKGIRLLHVFEDEWIYKKEIIKNKIINVLRKTENRIFARKCQIKLVSDKNEQRQFYNKNHVQGKSINIVSYGLYNEGKLCALMSFDKPRTNKKYEWELVRYVSCKDTVVTGGASKLLSYFIKNHTPNSIISYADFSWSIGNLYEKIGFILDGISKPSYFYVEINTFKRHHRFKFNKKFLIKNGLLTGNETEKEAMDRNDSILRIYDCGKLRYVWRKDGKKN